MARGNDRGAVTVRMLLSAALVTAPTGLGAVVLSAPASAAGMVLVCKYVGEPDGAFRLSDGKNPIEVSVNSRDAEEGFSDTHPSFVVDMDAPSACLPDLTIDKGAPPEALVGGKASYTLAVSNTGAHTYETVTVTDALPAEVELTAPASGTGWSCLGTRVINCTRSGRLVDAAPVITVPVTFVAEGDVDNTGSVSVEHERNATNNSDTARTVVTAVVENALPLAVDDLHEAIKGGVAADVVVLENDTPGDGETVVAAVGAATHGTAALVGDAVRYTPPAATSTATSATFTYTIADADGEESTALVTVALSDPEARNLVPGAAPDSATATRGAGSPTTIDLLANDALGNTPTTVVELSAPTAGTITGDGDGTVSYMPPAASDPAGSATFTYTIRDADGETSTALVTITLLGPRVDAQPAAADDTRTVAKGSGVTSLAVLDNDVLGDEPTTIVSVSAAQHGSVSVAGDSLSLVYAPPSAGTAGTNDTFSYTIRDADGDESSAQVTIALAEPIGGGGGGAGQLPADLAVKKTGPASTGPGDTATWTLTVTNKGPGSASGFTVTDQLPAGVGLTSMSGPGFTCSTLTCTYNGTLPVSGTARVVVVGAVASDATGSITNTAVVAPSDATPEDNTDTLVTVVEPPAGVADVALQKTGPDRAVLAGSAITWTITVTNVGTADAFGVTVTDALAAGVTLVEAAGDGFTCADGPSVSCTRPGALAAGQTVTLTVTGLIEEDYARSSVANTATAELAGDPTPGNNEDTATTGVNRPISGSPTDPGTGPEPTDPGSGPPPAEPAEPQPQPQPQAMPKLKPVQGSTPPQPAALPFTGGSSDLLLGLGAGLSVIGLLLALTGRRRRLVQ